MFIGDKQGADCGAAETGPTCRVRVGGQEEEGEETGAQIEEGEGRKETLRHN